MHILYHHRTQALGAEGSHIRGIINAFKQLGHQVTEVSPKGISSQEQEIINTKASKVQQIYSLVSKSIPQIGFEFAGIIYNLPSYRMILKTVSHEKIDFIYERYALYSISGTRLAKRYKIPMILEVNIISNLSDVRAVKMRNLAKGFENSILNNADVIVTVSGFLKNQLISLGIDGQKIWVIPNAVDPNEFYSGDGIKIRQEYNIEDSFVIGFVGSLSAWWYNLDTLIEIVSEIVSSGRNKIYLLMVGDGSQRPKLVELIQKRNLDNYVTITGWVEHKKIPAYIDAMDIAVIPNSNSWGSPMKMFEYMVMGKPVIAPAYEPIEEVITSGENGILFKPGDYDGLKQAILTLIDNDSLQYEIGDNAKNTVLKNHTWRKNAEKVIEIYRSIKDNI
jgi:glycosyltransferase involved in cell wall biosynthesis